MTSAKDFYDRIASDYDPMTRFGDRIKSEEIVLRGWRERYKFDSALDAGCGTGLHAVVLARIGVRTTAADISLEMLARARLHARAEKVLVEFVHSGMAELAKHVKGPFDSVFCLGNSLPHILTHEELAASLRSFAALLAPRGILTLQLLNYEKILTDRERIVGANTEGGTYFVRFYDFLGDLLQFNILTLRHRAKKLTHALSSTLLRPYRREDLVPELRRAGFPEIDCYGDMKFSPFDASSPNLVLVCRLG